jgi:hypothetical protein
MRPRIARFLVRGHFHTYLRQLYQPPYELPSSLPRLLLEIDEGQFLCPAPSFTTKFLHSDRGGGKRRAGMAALL